MLATPHKIVSAALGRSLLLRLEALSLISYGIGKPHFLMKKGGAGEAPLQEFDLSTNTKIFPKPGKFAQNILERPLANFGGQTLVERDTLHFHARSTMPPQGDSQNVFGALKSPLSTGHIRRWKRGLRTCNAVVTHELTSLGSDRIIRR